MIRLLLENWKIRKDDFISDIQALNENIVFITGKLAYSTIKSISDEINQCVPTKTRTKLVINRAFGKNVTVAGLLNASDIKEQITLCVNEIPAFSSNLFNEDDLTIDGVSKEELKNHFGNQLLIINEEFEEWMFLK